MKVNQIFSAKRRAITKASTTIMSILVLTSIVVSFSMVGLKFLWDLRAYHSRVTEEKEQVRDTLSTNIENIGLLKTSFNLLEQSKVDSKLVLDALPSKYDFPALATSVESLVTRSGLILSSFSGDDLEKEAVNRITDPEPIEIPLNISVEGPYKNLIKFVDILSKSIRPMQVNRIEIQGTDENIRADILLSSFYQPGVSLEVETRTIQ
jgi:Tfp pilus assembly protein PilO